MSEDRPRSFEEALRAIAQEVTRSVERLQDLDMDEVARTAGVAPELAKRWVEDAGEWLRERTAPVPARGGDPLRGAGPHPLDVPTGEQGLALAALDSGRWTLEPGTSALSV